MKKIVKIGVLSFITVLVTVSCTDLKIEETDSVIAPDGEFSGVEDVPGALDNLYNLLNRIGAQQNFNALNEVTTDEVIVPTRGTDWGDNGIWRTLHTHTWSSTHLYIFTTWNEFNQNVFLATEIIDPRSEATPQQLAEAKFLRALSMFWVMDMFGQVPFREADEGPDIIPRVMTRAEAYDFVLEDLIEALPDLPETAAMSSDTNRASQAAANFLLAKLYLNAHIYQGTGAPSQDDMTGVVNAVDAITADGYALQGGYFDIFTQAPDTETIFFVETSVGNRIYNGLHYNQNAPDETGGGWNGFTTLAEFYDLFEGDPNTNYVGDGQEERRGWVPDAATADASNFGIGYGFLIDQQYEEDGTPLSDRTGNPLVFTKDLPNIVGNNERTGIRVIKYHPADGSFRPHQIFFRYADAHLMKAEAIFRGGTSADDPITMVNNLRMLRSATPLASLTERDLLDERGRELYIEFWRRNDLIRFEAFNEDWEFKDPSTVGDTNKNIFPIPENALLSNPNLTQNPGY